MNDSGAVVRDLRADELGAALAINEANTPAVGSLDGERLQHLVAQCSIALAAEVGGELAGFCLVLAPGADYGSVNYRWFAARYGDSPTSTGSPSTNATTIADQHRAIRRGRRRTGALTLLEVDLGRATTARCGPPAPRLR